MNSKYAFLMLSILGSLISFSIAAMEQKRVTIWIHGTRGTAFPLFFINFSKGLSAIERAFCYCPPGLHAAHEISPELHQRKNIDTLSRIDSAQFPFEHCYLFGWSGNLSIAARTKAAKNLFEAVHTLVTQYRTNGIEPLITVITHSHGGNVALNAAAYASSNNPSFTIDRLVLLGTPIQQHTAHYANHPFFNSIYSIHSHADYTQVADPQKLQSVRHDLQDAWQKKSCAPLKKALRDMWQIPLFSHRHFKKNSKIKQICVSWSDYAPLSKKDFVLFERGEPIMRLFMKCCNWKGRGVLHIEMILPLFLERLPNILHDIDDTRHSLAPDIDRHMVLS